MLMTSSYCSPTGDKRDAVHIRQNVEPDRARAIFQHIVESTTWAAFGHIAAEAELARE